MPPRLRHRGGRAPLPGGPDLPADRHPRHRGLRLTPEAALETASRRAGPVVLALLLAGCGSKTGLLEPWEGIELPEACEVECEGSTFCRPLCQLEIGCVLLEPPDCDDGDECTADRCDDLAGACVHDLLVVDEDGDGFVAPLRCGGTDCDDDDPLVHPGAPERCNGVDDDCDDLVDEGADLVPTGEELPVAASIATDDASSVVWTGDRWIVGYWDYRDGDADVYLLPLDRLGEPDGAEVQVTTSAGDGFGPSMVWTGRELGVAWNDRRDGNFEVYFARFDGDLRRLTADLRLTTDPAWSVYPGIAWSGREYAVVWQDDRSGRFEVLALRVDADGPASAPVVLSASPADCESPSVAFAGDLFHFVWLEGAVGGLEVAHATAGGDLAASPARLLSRGIPGSAAAPTLAAGPSSLAIAWEQELAGSFETRFAILDAEGGVVSPPAPLPSAGLVAREAALLWATAGFLVVWSGFVGDGFDLFFSVLDPTGVLAVDARPLSGARGDAVSPHLALGPGEVGVLWSDSRTGDYDVYFTRLLCAGL